MKKKVVGFVIVIILLVFTTFIFIRKDDKKFVDSVVYNGNTYILLEYNSDIFTYNFNSNNYYEEDIIHPVSHDKWDVVYFNGDLFVLDKQNKKAIDYYADDKNYNWYIVFDDDIEKTISITLSELDYLYDIEDFEKKETIVFDDIEMFASILKVSDDELVQGIITLARVNNKWYYKTEVMTDDDREYVVEVIESLNDKINLLIDSE